jgi:hypothetical protein
MAKSGTAKDIDEHTISTRKMFQKEAVMRNKEDMIELRHGSH